MSSNFLTRPVDVEKVRTIKSRKISFTLNFSSAKFAVIFASAQKNFGASGLVLVILRKDLVDKVTNKSIPVNCDYKVQITNGSMYNTPPTFSYAEKGNDYLRIAVFSF